jgi:hypothetical protein
MKTSKLPVPHESEEQKSVAEYLFARPHIDWCHVPNGAGIMGGRFDGARIGKLKKLEAMGVRKGVPDLLVFTPPPAHPHAKGAAIELKRRKGGTVSPEQQEWLLKLTALGWKTAICKGADEAIQQLKEWGY